MSKTSHMQSRFCVVKLVNIAHCASHNAWAANIAIEWLPYSNVWENKFSYSSELKVKTKNLARSILVWSHSKWPYKNCGLKCITDGCVFFF